MHLIRRILIALALLLGGGGAHATCQVVTPVALGFTASSSYDVQNSAVPSTSASAGFICSGTLITVLSSNSASATITSTNNYVLKGPNGNAITYKLSPDAAFSKVFAQGATYDYMVNAALLGILTGGQFTPKFYAALTAAPNIEAGTYTDTLTIQWTWNVCHGVNALNVCILSETGSGTAIVNVSLVVGQDCRISAPPLSFGSAPLVSQFAVVNQAVSVDCTKNSTYNISFTSGLSGTSRPWRTMTDGAGNSLQYNIYRTDGTTIWDQTNPLASVTKGTGLTTPNQLQSYRAQINPAQTTPPAGHYTDTVSVVITF